MPDQRSPLQRFQAVVLADPALQRELRGTPDRAGFVALVRERARARGCPLETAEVEAALMAASRDWMLRQIR